MIIKAWNARCRFKFSESQAAQGGLVPNSGAPARLLSIALAPTPALRRCVHRHQCPWLHNQAPSTLPSPSLHTQSPHGHLSGLRGHTPATWSTYRRRDPGKKPAQAWETDSGPATRRIPECWVLEHGQYNSLFHVDGNVL